MNNYTENIGGPISVTDISKFTGDANEDSVVSGPVCDLTLQTLELGTVLAVRGKRNSKSCD